LANTVLIELTELALDIFGEHIIRLLPVFLLLFLCVRQIRYRRIDISIIAALFMILPALSPFLAALVGMNHYTHLNWDLQDNLQLVSRALILVCFFVSAFCIGAFFVPIHIKKCTPRKIRISNNSIFIIFTINFIAVLLFLEQGNIVNSAYSDFKSQGASPYSSLVNQILNLSIALSFAYLGKGDRKRLILTFYIILIIFALLISRRTLAVGLILLAAYSSQGHKLKLKQILLLVGSVILLWFIGEARKVGLISYLSGARLADTTVLVLHIPGGASNIFVSILGVLDSFEKGLISGFESFPIIFWLFGTNEAIIYSNLPYAYNGGMHLATVFYWNFGLLGILFGGILLGIISKTVQATLTVKDGSTDGTLRRMLCFAFVLLLPNLIWYHPTGLIKLSIAILGSFFFLEQLKKMPKNGHS